MSHNTMSEYCIWCAIH